MTRYLKAFVCLAAAFILAPAPAQTADQTKPAAKPVPIVYVARPTHIDGFVVASNGKLTPVPGSPLANIAVATSMRSPSRPTAH